ncbi:MAG: hypothetical protein ACE5IM_06780, partial [Nitrospinota bacterium]
MRFRKLPASYLLLGLFLSGCASYVGHELEPRGHISVANNPEYGAYLLAQERLNKIRPGIDRGTFLRKMQLRRLPSEDWYTTFSGGDGWLVGLSRKNQANEGNLFEEYSFGYHEGHRVVERNLVILKNGKVSSVLEHQLPQEPTAEGGLGALTAAKLPRALFTDDLTREEENYLLRNYIKKYHLTRQAFAQAEPR